MVQNSRVGDVECRDSHDLATFLSKAEREITT